MMESNINPKGNLVQFLSFQKKTVRVHLVNGEPVWIIKDVCQCLEIENHHNVIARLDSKGLHSTEPLCDVQMVDVMTQGGIQKMAACTEGGLYDIILGARGNKHTRPFQRWVTHEVLPAIRRQGYYSIEDIQLLKEEIANLRTRIESLEGKNVKRLKGMHLKKPEGLEVVAEWLAARTRELEADEYLTPSRILYADFQKWGGRSTVVKRVSFRCFCISLGLLDVPARLAYDERGYRHRSRPVKLDG